MAKKKVVVNESGGKKKKRHGCCTCLLVALIVFVVILGAGVGVGWYFGDKYTKQYIGMSLKDCFGVVSDLTHAREKKIVQKSYSGTSETEFEDGLKKQLFLNENADLNKDALLEQFLGNKGGSSDGSNNTLERALKANGASLYEGEIEPPAGEEPPIDAGEDGGNDNGGNDGGNTSSGGESNAIMDYVASLFTRENMDLNALQQYSESNHNEYILSFSDVQLAAFLSSAIKAGLDSEAVSQGGALESLSGILGDKKLSEVVFLDQIVFYGTQEAPHMKLTLSLDIRAVAGGVARNSTGMNLDFLLKIFLPKRLYLTADMTMNDEARLDLFINEMNDRKMDRFYKFVNGIQTVGEGGGKDIKETINESAGKIVGGVANALKEYGNLSEIENGKIKIDLLQTLINVAKLNEGKEEAQQLKSSDIIYALKYVVASDFDEAVDKDATWINRYYDTGNPGAPAVYKDPSQVGDRDERANYDKELIAQLGEKYLIKTKDELDNDKSFKELLGMFSMSGDEGGTVLDWIDSDKLGVLAKDDGDLQVYITNEMLGAIFDAEIASVISSNGSIADMNPKVYQIKIEKRPSDGRTFLSAGIAVDPSGILGGSGGGIGGMIGGLFGEHMMLSFTMEINLDAEGGYEYEPTTLALNNLSNDDMNNFINILSKFGVDFSVGQLGGQIEQPMRDALGNMKAQMPSLRLEDGKLVLPSIFDVTADKMLGGVTYKDAVDADKPLTGDDLKGVIDSLCNYTKADEKQYKRLMETEAAAFVAQMIAARRIGEDELGRYLTTMMEDNDNFKGFANLVGMDIVGSTKQIKMTVKVEKDSLFGEGNDGGDFNKFMPIKNIYVEVTVDLDKLKTDGEKQYYESFVTINGMDEVERNKFEAVIGKFNNSAQEINFDERAKDLGGMVRDLLINFDTFGGIDVQDGYIAAAN